jgi:TolA-binding protein
MAKKDTDKIYEAELRVEAKARGFFEKNSKIIAGITVVAILVIILGYGYKQMILGPKEAKAQTQMIRAQQYFEMDSFNLALNGDGVSQGFKDIVSQYGSTKAGNGAKFYAGVSALQSGDFKGALEYLESFSTDDAMLNARKYGCIGDAHAELKDMVAAESNYSKAVDADADNTITAPFYLYKLAKSQVENKKTDDAIKNLEALTEKFPTTPEGTIAQIDLAKLQASK